MNELSRIWQVQWMSRCCFIHLLDHHMLFQRSTTCSQYHRLNEGRDPSPYSHWIIVGEPWRKNLQRYHVWNGGWESILFIYAVVWLCGMEVIRCWNITCFSILIIWIYVKVLIVHMKRWEHSGDQETTRFVKVLTPVIRLLAGLSFQFRANRLQVYGGLMEAVKLVCSWNLWHSLDL
jgi:hypothetical protein